MDRLSLHHALEEALRRCGVAVRAEPLAARGGLCRIGSQRVVLVDSRAPLQERIDVLARALASLPEADDVFLSPAVRAHLESLKLG